MTIAIEIPTYNALPASARRQTKDGYEVKQNGEWVRVWFRKPKPKK